MGGTDNCPRLVVECFPGARFRRNLTKSSLIFTDNAHFWHVLFLFQVFISYRLTFSFCERSEPLFRTTPRMHCVPTQVDPGASQRERSGSLCDTELQRGATSSPPPTRNSKIIVGPSDHRCPCEALRSAYPGTISDNSGGLGGPFLAAPAHEVRGHGFPQKFL